MRARPVLVERSEAFSAPVEQVWPLVSGPGALALRPRSFAFDVAAPDAARIRVVLSILGITPIFVTYEVCEEVRGRVVSLTVPGRQPNRGEVLTLSAVPERAGSRVTIQVRWGVANRKGRSVVEGYWEQALPLWLAGLRDVAEGRAPVPEGGMPAWLQAACVPAALPGPYDSVSASAAIAATAGEVWEAVCAPESTILMSPGGAGLAGVIPGTPVRQVGEMQYFIWRLDDGQLNQSVTMARELSAGRFALISQVGRSQLEMLHNIEPDGQQTRLDLTFRWAANIPDRQAVAASMADTVRARVQSFKDLIENPGSHSARRSDGR